MSGGVDSSVSAGLLKEQGYDVTGVFMKTWHPDFLPCTWRDERRDAMRVCAVLDIPFVTFDLEEVYKKEVAEYMIQEYKEGRTPNPDVMCNKAVKFGTFFERAMKEGADMIATGHYAQVHRSKENFVELVMGKDQNKDQTYFLWTLPQEVLQKTLFPIGHLEKSDVRHEAKRLGLPVAEKKDSQGVCFLGEVEMREFLKRYIDVAEGNVINITGEVIGTHEGALLYTLGQRHGFTVTQKGPNDGAHYVVAKDIQANTITVATDFKTNETFTQKKVVLENVHWIAGHAPDVTQKYQCRFRYRQTLQECTLKNISGEVTVHFKKPQRAVAEGQSVVIYDEGICLGGGIVT